MGLSLSFILLFSACTVALGPGNESSFTESTQSGDGPPASLPEDEIYRVYGPKDLPIFETKNIFSAYIVAGKRGTTQNRTHITYHGKEIFSWGKKQYYKLIGSSFSGFMKADEAAARNWASGWKNSYVIDEKAQRYVALGRKDMSYSPFKGLSSDAVTQGIEYFSGSYNYMFSKRKVLDAGYISSSYIEFLIDMTGMEFRYPEYEHPADMTEPCWNAYIFTNFFTNSPWSCCDIGLIASAGIGEGIWRPIFNLGGTMISPVPVGGGEAGEPVAMMTKDGGAWRTDAILDFRAYVTRKSYCLEITNFVTGSKHAFKVDCRTDALKKKAHEPYTMVAASYCPCVEGTQVWNARSGAVMRGLRFYNIKTAGFIEGAASAADYENAAKYAFMPGCGDIYSYGFAQGDDNSDFMMGKDEKGSYLECSIYYTGDKKG